MKTYKCKNTDLLMKIWDQWVYINDNWDVKFTSVGGIFKDENSFNKRIYELPFGPMIFPIDNATVENIVFDAPDFNFDWEEIENV